MTKQDFEAFENIIEMLRDLMEQQAKTFDQAVEQLKKICIPEQLNGALAHFEKMQAEFNRTDGYVIRGLGAAKPWYPGTRANNVFWPRLRAHLASNGWTSSDIEELDKASNIVLASCQSPWQAKSSGRGLVIGYVQSGKTTNFTAVMAKAADAGFRLVIVMSGLTKSLRNQTQRRLDEQLRDLSPNSWIFLTEKDKDFDKGIGMGPVLYHPALRTCVVVKKNKSRLNRLNKFLDAAEKAGQLNNCPILIIDDEGDQASLSPNCDQEKATKINNEIVKMLNRPRVSYVAYTATPFANVFVNPHYEENLYPRDFIYSLPESKGYFGARVMFGTDSNGEAIDVIRTIPTDEMPNFFGTAAPKRTQSLEASIRWFLIAATIRRLRNSGTQPHTTMLINASERIQYHFDLWFTVRDIVLEIRNRINTDPAIKTELEDLWRIETEILPAGEFNNSHFAFEQVLSNILTTIELLGPLDGMHHDHYPNCGIIVDNSGAEVRLAYSDSAPRPIIVIGGNTLSRGLTLEGLVCSVFARSTKLYDTLLQMARWFGFRRGYEDLPRVFMFDEVRQRFEFLARIEMEIREEILRYAATGLSPLDFGVRIRLHPLMQITRAAMLGGARRIKFDFSATRPQTTFLENTSTAISRAIKATNSLISSIIAAGVNPEITGVGTLFRAVDASFVRKFFSSEFGYPLSDSNEYLNNEPLCKYIDLKTSRGEIQKWNILFKSLQNSRECSAITGVKMRVITRSRLKNVNDGQTFSMGAINDPNDMFVDLPNDPQRVERSYNEPPLLIIYAIDKDSKPNLKNSNRQALGALDDMIGLWLLLPMSNLTDDLGEFAVVHGPWDIPAIGEPDDTEDDETLDGEGDANPEVPNLAEGR
jgi:hypothetical protein